MAGISIDLKGRDAGAEAVLGRAQKLVGQLEQRFRAAALGAKQSDAEVVRFGRDAQRVLREAAKPADRYKQVMGELQKGLQAGKLSQDEYARAVEVAKNTLKASTAAEAESARQKARMANEAARVIDSLKTPQDRYKERLLELSKLEKAGELTKKQLVAAIRQEKAALAEATGETKRATEEDRRATAEKTRWGNAARRAIESQMSPMQRYRANMREIIQARRAGNVTDQEFIALKRQERDVLRNTTTEMSALATVSKGAIGPQMISWAKGLAGALGLGGGVAGMISLVNQGYEVWIQNQREIASQANKAVGSFIALAALQEGGEKAKRVTRTAELAAQYGIDLGEAYTTVQAMQSSAGGDFEKGFEASKTIFAAGQVGIPVELGRELEVIGTTRGAQPGQTLRRSHVAGQLSKRSPDVLAKGASSLTYWEDPDFAFASAAVLAGEVAPEMLRASFASGGVGLSATGGAKKKWDELGMADASQFDRLTYLKQQGIDTTQELAQFGYAEREQQKAVATLVTNYNEILRFQKTIEDQAKPGIFVSQRQAIEAELPTAKPERRGRMISGMMENEEALGDQAVEGQKYENWRKKLALAFFRTGNKQAGPFDLIEGSGKEARSGMGDLAQYKFVRGAKAGGKIMAAGPAAPMMAFLEMRKLMHDPVANEMKNIDRQLEAADAQMQAAAAQKEAAAAQKEAAKEQRAAAKEQRAAAEGQLRNQTRVGTLAPPAAGPQP